MHIRRIAAVAAAAAAAVALSSAAYAGDADFRLRNKTGYQIDEVYVSARSSKNWGDDIMGDSSLADGSSVNITFPHGGNACHFDIKVKYNDGDTAQWGDVDLCQYETISLFWDAKTHSTRAVGE